MASPNPETTEIRRKGRQRLIGAITIVLLLVVFVPMMLDPEPRQPGKDAVLAIPPKEGAAPLPTPSAPAKLAEAPKAEAPKAEAPKAEPPRTERPKAEAKPAAVATVPKLEGYAIQVGAFADDERLRLAREKLAAARIVHFTERLPTGLTRLRAGPYPTREAADKAVAAVNATGLDGKVVALP